MDTCTARRYINGILLKSTLNTIQSINQSINQCRHFGFELIQDPPNLRDSSPSDFYLFPKLKSHLSGRHFGNNPCWKGVPGGRGATIFSEGIAMHEHRLTKCFDVKGNYMYNKNSKKLPSLCHLFLVRLGTFWMTLVYLPVRVYPNFSSANLIRIVTTKRNIYLFKLWRLAVLWAGAMHVYKD